MDFLRKNNILISGSNGYAVEIEIDVPGSDKCYVLDYFNPNITQILELAF